jgi:hypothetical protein
MNIVLHTFGSELKYYLQSIFLILNWLQYKNQLSSINIVTERPAYYARLEKYISITGVDESTIKNWKGEYEFKFRVKLKAIELFLTQNTSMHPLLYLDTDTFIYQGFNELKETLISGKGLMHMNEGKLSECPTRSGSRMWNRVKNQTFAGNTITKYDSMWNAGVIGIPVIHCRETIDTAITMCDEMCSRIPLNFLIEQFCVSVALQRKVEVQPAVGYIGHYWGNRIGWNNLIAAFFTESYLNCYSVEDDIERLASFNFKQIPIAVISGNTEKKLHNVVNKYFKPRVYTDLQKGYQY